jgi:tRNA (adenine22-N1)-methyltransferase
MGGRMIASILKTADLSHVKRLILIANSENFLLRDFLEQAEWKIIAEELIKENGKFYQLLILEKGLMKLSDIEKEFGPLIIKEKSENFKEMIRLLLKKLIVAKLEAKSDSAKEKIETRINELEGVLR